VVGGARAPARGGIPRRTDTREDTTEGAPDRLVTTEGVIGSFGCAPELAEVVKLADVAGLLASVPVGGDALEVGGQAVGVADERDPLAFGGEPTGLLDGEECFAVARSPANLDAVEQLVDALKSEQWAVEFLLEEDVLELVDERREIVSVDDLTAGTPAARSRRRSRRWPGRSRGPSAADPGPICRRSR